MKTLLILASLSIVFVCANAAHAVTFDWAHIGNAGNAADDTGFGAVAYNYAISKTEVTNAQYVEFLNAVDPLGTNSLGLFSMNMPGPFGGIDKTGTMDGDRYVAQAGREENPVSNISWYDSVRFINWLQNGQGSGDTETGAYTLLGGIPTPSNGLSITRNPSATYWLPSENEWYKAAYHDSSAGIAGVYFDYATGSDSIPLSDQPSDVSAAVNYFSNDGIANGFNDGYAVSGSTEFGTNPFTDVSAYIAAGSTYGTFDQNGNVWEWNETLIGSTLRGLRGGSWNVSFDRLSARGPLQPPPRPSLESSGWGFRVATFAVPEPTSLLLLLSVTSGMFLQRRR